MKRFYKDQDSLNLRKKCVFCGRISVVVAQYANMSFGLCEIHYEMYNSKGAMKK